jgi:predicted nucleic acid-binding protein
MPTVDSHAEGAVVIDASAAVALLIDPGPEADAIASRIAGIHLLGPGLLPFEVASVLRRRRNSGLLAPEQADHAHAKLLQLPIDLWDWEALAERAWKLGHNLTSYDAAYVALAELTNSPLITRDTRIAATPGIRCVVEVM